MRTKLTFVTCSLCFVLFSAKCQDSIYYTFEKRVYLSLYNWPGLLGMGVKGQLIFDGKEIVFTPDERSFLNPYNDCIKPLTVNLDQISSIRRNWFFIVPNRLVLKTTDKRTFRFLMYGQRKKLIRLVEEQE